MYILYLDREKIAREFVGTIVCIYVCTVVCTRRVLWCFLVYFLKFGKMKD